MVQTVHFHNKKNAKPAIGESPTRPVSALVKVMSKIESIRNFEEQNTFLMVEGIEVEVARSDKDKHIVPRYRRRTKDD